MSTTAPFVPRDTGAVDSQNPWPGLASFREGDRAFFRGRESEIDELHRLVRRERLTIVFGHSGLGKTSLLQAGLFPRLREESGLPVYVRLDHTRGGAPLRQQVESAILSQAESAGIETPAAREGETLWEYFHREEAVFWNQRNRPVLPVLVFDQFEEIFTLGKEGPGRAAASEELLVELGDLVEGRPPASVAARLEQDPAEAAHFTFSRHHYKILISLREDFLAELEALRERIPSISHNRMRLRRMTGEQARDVVGQTDGRLVADEAVEPIVRFVAGPTSERKPFRDITVDPALLSVFCRELNNKRVQLGQARISTELVEGSWAEILTDFYERSLSDQPPEVRTFVEENLLTVSGFRDSVALENALTTPGVTEAAIRALVDRRLLRLDELAGIRRLELAHDVLTDVVRSSRDMRREREERSAAEAARVAAEERERHMRAELRRSRRTSVLLAGLALLAIASAAWGWRAQSRAQAEEQRARQAAHSELQARQQSDRDRAEAEHAGAEAVRALAELSRANDALRLRTEREAAGILDRIRLELYRLTPKAADHVTGGLDRIVADAAQFESPELRHLSARAHAVTADVLYAHGRISEGLAKAEEALRLTAELDALEEPEIPVDLIRAEAQYAYGKALLETGRLAAAQSAFAAAVDLAERLARPAASGAEDAARVRALASIGLGDVMLERFQLEEAAGFSRELMDWLQARRPTLPDAEAQYSYWEVLALLQLAWAHQSYDAAQPYYAAAGDIIRRMGAENPDNLQWMRLAVEASYRESLRMRDVADVSETRRRVSEAVDGARTLHNLDTDNLEWRWALAQAYRVRGLLDQKIAEPARARDAFDRSFELAAGVSERQPSWTNNRYVHAISLYYRGETAPAEDADDAMRLYAESARQLDELVADLPDHPEFLRSAAIAHYHIGSGLIQRQDYDTAFGHFRRALRRLDRIPPRVRGMPHFQDIVAFTHHQTAFAYSGSGRLDEAVQSFREALRVRDGIVESAPDPASYIARSYSHYWLGDTYLGDGDETRGYASLLEVMRNLEEGLARFPGEMRLLEEKTAFATHVARRLRRGDRLSQTLDVLAAGAEAGTRAFSLDPVHHQIFSHLTTIREEVDSLRDVLRGQSGAGQEIVAVDDLGPRDLLQKVEALRASLIPHRMLWPKTARADDGAIRVEQPMDWEVPPLIPGVWRILGSSEREAEIARLAELEAVRDFAPEIVRIRALPVSFYPGAVLHEAEVRSSNGGHSGVLAYVRRDAAVLLLDGTAEPIHAFNPGVLQLHTQQQAMEYIQFFMAAVGGSNGNFRIISDVMELEFVAAAREADRTEIAHLIAPPEIRERGDGSWDVRATTRFHVGLFAALLRVPLDGNVRMQHDTPITTDQPIVYERHENGLRVRSDMEQVRLHVRQAAARAANAGRWREALERQAVVVSMVEAELERGEDVAAQLANAHVGIAWYRLFVRDFEGSLAASKAAHSYDDGSLAVLIDTNLAHALLFLGRVEEAEAVYLAHIGKQVFADRDDTWEEAIIEDFGRLTEAGVTHRDMDRIRHLLSR